MRNRKVWVGVLLLPLLALAWWAGSPLFLDRSVDEAFPLSSAAPASDGATETPEAVEASDDETGAMEASDTVPPEEEAVAAATMSIAAEPEPTLTPSGERATEETVGGSEEEVEPTAEPTAEPPVPAGPVPRLQGTFRDVDAVHRGSGSATVYELPEGGRVLRLEPFEVTNGPDLFVLLVPRHAINGEADIAGYVELAPLKGNVGNQNYELPATLDLAGEWSVVIWCKTFNVNFSIAELGGV